MDAHGVAAPRIGVALRVGMIEVQHAALADHRVVIEILLQSFPQLHRQFVERDIAGQQIVGADDGGVAADIAAADPALLEHGDVGESVLLGEVERGREAVAAATDDDDVVPGLRCRVTPLRLASAEAGNGIPEQRYDRIAHVTAFRLLRDPHYRTRIWRVIC